MSRGATLCLGVFAVIFMGWFLLRRKFRPQPSVSSPAIKTAVIALFGTCFLYTVLHLDMASVYGRFDAMATEQSKEEGVWTRVLVHDAAADMLKANWLRGVGGGGFRYLFPEYVKSYPEIYHGGEWFWEHAHSDWLEIPIEVGLIGDLLFAGAALWWISFFVRSRMLWNSMAMPLLLGCLQTLVHASFDFPFQCPAILVSWCVLVTVAGRWTEIERTG